MYVSNTAIPGDVSMYAVSVPVTYNKQPQQSGFNSMKLKLRFDKDIA